MNAILCPSRATAIAFSDTVEECETVRACTNSVSVGTLYEAARWIVETESLIILEGVDPDSLQQRVQLESELHSDILFITVLFDIDISLATRVEVAQEIEKSSNLGTYFQRIGGLLYSAPLPPTASFHAAIEASEKADAHRLCAFIKILQTRQPLINNVAKAWERLPDENFTDEGTRERARDVYVKLGIFRDLVQSLEQCQLDDFRLTQLSRTGLPSFCNNRMVLENWTRSFRNRQSDRSKEPELFKRSDDWESRDAYTVIFKNDTPIWQKRQHVEAARQEIKTLLDHLDTSKAQQRVEWLVQYQVERNDAAYGAMSLCDLATHALSVNQPEIAFGWLEWAIQLAPLDRVARCAKAECIRELGRVAEALDAYDLIIQEFPFDSVSQCGRAECLKELGRVIEALEAYDKIVDRVPTEPIPRNGRAGCLRELGRALEALAEYELTLKIQPTDRFTQCAYAECLRDLGRTEEAFDAYATIVRNHPQDTVPRCGQAECLRELGRTEEALFEYEATIRIRPNNRVARCGRAECLRELGRSEEALASYSETLSLYPASRFAQCGQAECFRDLGRMDEALAAYELAMTSFPIHPVPRCGFAECLRELDRIHEALSVYERVITQHPTGRVAYCGRAECFRDLGRLDIALSAYETTIERFPHNRFALCGRAECLRELGRTEEALICYGAVITDFPNDIIAQTGYAECLRDSGNITEAISFYEGVIQRLPFCRVAYCGRAESLRESGRTVEALAAFELAIERFRKDKSARIGRARCLRQLGHLEKALNAYEEILADHPSDKFARNGRNVTLIALKRYDDALLEIPSIQPTTRSEWIASHIRGVALLRAGKLIEADEVFTAGVMADLPDRDASYFRTALGLCRLLSRKASEALKCLEGIKSRKLSVPIEVIRAHAFGEQGETDNCRDVLLSLFDQNESKVRRVADELFFRFIERDPKMTVDWLFDEEIEILLAA